MSFSKGHLPALAAAVGALWAGASPPHAGGFLAGAGWGLALAQSSQAPGQGLPEESARLLAQAQEALDNARVAKGQQQKATFLEQARKYFSYVNVSQAGTPEAMFGVAEVERELATLNSRWGEMKKAMDYYQAYLKLTEGRTDHRAYEGLGRVYLHANYYRLAEPQFRRAVQFNAASAEAWEGWAQALRGLKETDQAYESISHARELAPNDVGILQTFVQICLESIDVTEEGRPLPRKPEWLDQALLACNRGVDLLHLEWERSPEDTELLQKRDQFYELIIKITGSQLGSMPQLDAELVIRLVRIRREQQKVQRLLADHQSLMYVLIALQSLPEDIALLSLATQLQFQLNLREQARETCEKILSLDPQNQQARNMLNELSSGSAAMSSLPR